MSRRFLLVLAMLAAVLPVGCSYFSSGGSTKKQVSPLVKEKSLSKKRDFPGTPEQEAVLRVMEADKAAFKAGFAKLEVDSPPSVFSRFLTEYVAAQEKADFTSVPAEFQAVYGRHTKAWKALHSAVSRLPDAYTGTDFMDSIHALFHSDPSRGRVLGGDVITSIKKVNAAFAELYTAAENYGLEVD